MKNSRFAVFFLLFILLSCSGEGDKNLHDNSGKSLTLTGTQQRDTVFLKFSIPEKTVFAARTGKLERLVENPEFKKNSLLVQFDNYDAFVELSGEKEALKEDLTNQLNNLPNSLQTVEKKWRDFANKLTPDRPMPDFPALEYKEEAGFMEEAKIQDKYNAIHKKELALQNYFQLSSEDGFIIKAFAHTDDNVKKSKALILYHPKKVSVTAEAAFPLTPAITKQIKSDLSLRIPVDQIRKNKASSQKITYTLTLNQRLDPKICPKYIIVNQEQNAFRVPKEFVGSQNMVQIQGGKEQLKAYQKNGSYYVYSKESALKVQRK